MWLRELLELLDQNKQQSLFQNVVHMHIRQQNVHNIELHLRHCNNVIANRVILEPYKVQGRYMVSFWRDCTPKCKHKDLSISEIKYLLNQYTILEII